jgi:hypothetical protein
MFQVVDEATHDNREERNANHLSGVEPARSSVRFSPTGKLGTKNKRARTTKIVTGRNVPKISDLLK